MATINCLTRALDQWNDNKYLFRLWYNSNHVISLENTYSGHDLIDNHTHICKYLPLRDYGYNYFSKSFDLSIKYNIILANYLTYEDKYII